jgi:hypothetical protein
MVLYTTSFVHTAVSSPLPPRSSCRQPKWPADRTGQGRAGPLQAPGDYANRYGDCPARGLRGRLISLCMCLLLGRELHDEAVGLCITHTPPCETRRMDTVRILQGRLSIYWYTPTPPCKTHRVYTVRISQGGLCIWRILQGGVPVYNTAHPCNTVC